MTVFQVPNVRAHKSNPRFSESLKFEGTNFEVTPTIGDSQWLLRAVVSSKSAQ